MAEQSLVDPQPAVLITGGASGIGRASAERYAHGGWKVAWNDRASVRLVLKRMGDEGWELVSITPGVYSADKSTGIFVTRYLFKRKKA